MKNLVDDESICDVSMPYVKLWRAVLYQALEDAVIEDRKSLASVTSNKSESSRKVNDISYKERKKELDRHSAKSWVLYPREDYRQVCNLAFIDGEVIRRYLLTNLQEGDTLE